MSREQSDQPQTQMQAGDTSGEMTIRLAAGILRAALDCIVVMSHESRIVEWNKAAERTFGYTRAEAIGAEMASLIIPPALRDAHCAGLAHYLTTGDGPILNRRIEVIAVRRDGTQFPIELAVVPIDEHPPRFAAYLRDITVRTEQEAALRRSEERFRSLVAASSEIVWVSAPDGTFETEQAEWTAFTGQTFEQFRGWGWLAAIFPEDRKRIEAEWKRAVRGAALYTAEYRLRRRDGVYRFMSVRAAPVVEPDGSIREWVGVNTDSTARREAENALARSEARQRVFLRDILASVTEGKLFLCETEADLPPRLDAVGDPIFLSPARLYLLRRRTTKAARAVGMDTERGSDLLTAIGEASMNAVVHAGGGTASVGADVNRGSVQVWVEDRGAGIEISHLPRATLDRGYTTAGSLGHGFKMLLSAADRVWLLTGPTGTTVVVEQDRDAAKPSWMPKV